MNPAVEALNRGKRSIVLDLKHPGARPLLEKLVKWADVVTFVATKRVFGLCSEKIIRILSMNTAEHRSLCSVCSDCVRLWIKGRHRDILDDIGRSAGTTILGAHKEEQVSRLPSCPAPFVQPDYFCVWS